MDNTKPRYIHADDRFGKPNVYLNTDQIVSLTKNTVNDGFSVRKPRPDKIVRG